MIVVDASAMVEALVGISPDEQLLDAISGEMAAPELLDTEVLGVLRGLVLGNVISQAVAEQAIDTYYRFCINRYTMRPIAKRVWSLRHQYTAYDASYIALAEALGIPLVTCDKKLVGNVHHAQVRVFARNN